MRLVRKLVKVTAVLAVAAAALGGAAALGSSLFEEPPRDADDFARRLEASRPLAEPPRTRPERRYARALNELCGRQRARLDALGEPESASDVPAWLREAKPLLRRHRDELAALPAPATYAEDAAELAGLQDRIVAVWERLARRLREGDRSAPTELRPVLEHLDSRADAVYVRLGGRACVRD